MRAQQIENRVRCYYWPWWRKSRSGTHKELKRQVKRARRRDAKKDPEDVLPRYTHGWEL